MKPYQQHIAYGVLFLIYQKKVCENNIHTIFNQTVGDPTSQTSTFRKIPIQNVFNIVYDFMVTPMFKKC